MTIEFVDLKKQYAAIKKEIDAAILRVVKKQYFILGSELEAFEEQFAQYLHSPYVVGVDNGTDGLILAMQALGIGKGDEVITPVNSYISTTYAITEVGAIPVFVDVDPETHQLDIQQVENKITKKTKAVLPVHLYGGPCEIDRLMVLSKKHGFQIVEDACQAHGATYNGKRLGTFGIIGVFSFYPGKNLGAYGNGGAVVTSNKKIYEKLIKLRNFGQSRRYYHDIIGGNSKLDDIQAAVLSVKLKYLDAWNKRRNQLAMFYRKNLPEFKTPQMISRGISNYHLFVIECDRRNALREYLIKRGVMAQIHYPVPIHLQKCYRYLGYKKGDFPTAEKIVSRIISLPMHPQLQEKDISFIVESIKIFYGKERVAS